MRSFCPEFLDFVIVVPTVRIRPYPADRISCAQLHTRQEGDSQVKAPKHISSINVLWVSMYTTTNSFESFERMFPEGKHPPPYTVVIAIGTRIGVLQKPTEYLSMLSR